MGPLIKKYQMAASIFSFLAISSNLTTQWLAVEFVVEARDFNAVMMDWWKSDTILTFSITNLNVLTPEREKKFHNILWYLEQF